MRSAESELGVCAGGCASVTRLVLDIGEAEKHRVEYYFGDWWGRAHISVDGRIVKKDDLFFYGNLSAILGAVAIGFWALLLPSLILFLPALDFVLSRDPSLFYAIILPFIVGILVLLPLSGFGIILIGVIVSILWWSGLGTKKLMIGESEKHSVKIRMIWKPFPALMEKEFEVHVDGELFDAAGNLS
jgi:hypothetical protein